MGRVQGPANSFLESLLSGQLPEKQVPVIERERELIGIPGRIESDEEEQLLNDCNQWIMKQGLSEGKIGYELLDPETEELLATLDLAWPNGLQEGLSEPVTLLIGEGKEMEEIVNRAGYRYFTNVEDFERYVNSEILGLTNKPVKRPDTTSESGSGSIELEVTVEGRLEKYPPKIKELFNLLDQEIKSISDDIWRKVGTTLLSYSCPKRTFIYVRFQKQGVKLTVFTGGQQIDGVKNVDYEKAGAKWGRIYFKNEDDLQSVMAAIKKSYELIREAIKKNENTSWYAKLEDEIENDATDV